MVWVRLDDHFDEHPKIAAVGPLGLALWVSALAYCNRNLTDGFVPTSVARTLVCWQVTSPTGATWDISITHMVDVHGSGEDVDSDMVLDQLVAVGLLDEVPGGYRIHDYAEYQPSKEAVRGDRDAAKERMRKVRGARSAGVRPNSTRTSPNPEPVPEPSLQVVEEVVPSAREEPFDHGSRHAMSAIELAVRRMLNGGGSERQVETMESFAEQVGEATVLECLATWATKPIRDRYGGAMNELQNEARRRRGGRDRPAEVPAETRYDDLIEAPELQSAAASAALSGPH
jgi:hypothetical protein